ncbi:MAG: hypothetical protein JJE48_10665 [Actinobacteria bacterium]|nr:hypothetical protein [Actinomycetota bacterium]
MKDTCIRENIVKKLLLGLLLVAAIGAAVYFKMNKGCAPCCGTDENCCQ